MIADVPVAEIRDLGEGHPVVLIHPLGANVHYWDGLVARLPDRRLISYNLPGHGGRAATPSGYRIEDLAEDLLRLLDSLGVQTASVVGVSIGGLVGQAFAASHPERIASLVLVDCVPVYSPEFAAALTARADLVQREGLTAVVQPTREMWFTAATARPDTELSALVEQMLLSADEVGYAQACAALVAADLTSVAGDIKADTTVVCGEDDLPVFVEGSRWLSDRIPGARLEWLAGGRHGASLECMPAFADILDEVLPR